MYICKYILYVLNIGICIVNIGIIGVIHIYLQTFCGSDFFC